MKQRQMPPTPMSIDSDYEFWEEFERKPNLQLQGTQEKEVKQEAVKLLSAETLEISIQDKSTEIQSNRVVDVPETPDTAMQQPVDVVSQAKNPEIASTTVVVREETSREYETAIDGLTGKQESELKEWKAKYDGLIVETTKIRSEIARLQVIVYDQEIELTHMRSRMDQQKEVGEMKNRTLKIGPIDPETDEKVLLSQVEAFKGLLDYYDKQANDYKRANVQLTSELNGIKDRHHNEMSVLTDSIKAKEDRFVAEKTKLMDE